MTGIWLAWMAAMTVQVGALILVVLLLDRALRGWVWPQLRHALWLLVALKLLLPPTLSSPVSVTSVGVEPPLGAAPWLFLVWLAGVALFGVFAWRRVRHARRKLLEHCSPPRPHHLAALSRACERLNLRPPRLLIGTTAAAFGLLRPTVVAPRDAGNLDHVLLHEVAPVKRRDLWAQALFGLLHLAYWFHPLVWVACVRAYAVREVCCDATAAGVLGDEASAYRETLKDAARRLLRRQPGLAGYILGPSMILLRLQALERQWWRRPVLRRATCLCVALLVSCTVLPMADRLQWRARRIVDSVLSHPDDYGCVEIRNAAVLLYALEQRKQKR